MRSKDCRDNIINGLGQQRRVNRGHFKAVIEAFFRISECRVRCIYKTLHHLNALNVILSHSVHNMGRDTDAAELYSEQLDVLP